MDSPSEISRTVRLLAASLRHQYETGRIPPEAMTAALDTLTRVADRIDLLRCFRDTEAEPETGPASPPPPAPPPVTPEPARKPEPEPEPADNITFLPAVNARRGSLRTFTWENRA